MTVEVQPTPSPESIDLNSSDEDLIRYVSHRKNGDPLPPNVIPNVNPFFIKPLNAHGGSWYLCSLDDSEHAKGGKVRTMEGGYWKQKGNDELIHVNRQRNGRKVSWEFFRGNEPFGDRTAWMMVEYHSNYKEIQDENDKQEFNSLCRIYCGNSDEPCVGERHDGIDVNENSSIALEAKLLKIHEVEKNTSKSESAKESQVVDKKIPSHPSERYGGYNIDTSVDIQGYDDPNEDNVRLEDFFDEMTSPSSFENSSRYSEIPDDYFDPAPLLSLVGEGNVSVGQESSAGVSVADNLRSDQVVNESSPSEGAQSNGIDKSVPMQGIGNNSIPSPGLPVGASANLYRVQRPTSSLAMCIPSSSSKASRSMIGEGSRKQKRAPSRSSDGSCSGSSRDSGSGRSPLGSGSPPSDSHKSSSGSRIKRLGKKYCCLGPF